MHLRFFMEFLVLIGDSLGCVSLRVLRTLLLRCVVCISCLKITWHQVPCSGSGVALPPVALIVLPFVGLSVYWEAFVFVS